MKYTVSHISLIRTLIEREEQLNRPELAGKDSPQYFEEHEWQVRKGLTRLWFQNLVSHRSNDYLD